MDLKLYMNSCPSYIKKRELNRFDKLIKAKDIPIDSLKDKVNFYSLYSKDKLIKDLTFLGTIQPYKEWYEKLFDAICNYEYELTTKLEYKDEYDKLLDCVNNWKILIIVLREDIRNDKIPCLQGAISRTIDDFNSELTTNIIRLMTDNNDFDKVKYSNFFENNKWSELKNLTSYEYWKLNYKPEEKYYYYDYNDFIYNRLVWNYSSKSIKRLFLSKTCDIKRKWFEIINDNIKLISIYNEDFEKLKSIRTYSLNDIYLEIENILKLELKEFRNYFDNEGYYFQNEEYNNFRNKFDEEDFINGYWNLDRILECLYSNWKDVKNKKIDEENKELIILSELIKHSFEKTYKYNKELLSKYSDDKFKHEDLTINDIYKNQELLELILKRGPLGIKRSNNRNELIKLYSSVSILEENTCNIFLKKYYDKLNFIYNGFLEGYSQKEANWLIDKSPYCKKWSNLILSYMYQIYWFKDDRDKLQTFMTQINIILNSKLRLCDNDFKMALNKLPSRTRLINWKDYYNNLSNKCTKEWCSKIVEIVTNGWNYFSKEYSENRNRYNRVAYINNEIKVKIERNLSIFVDYAEEEFISKGRHDKDKEYQLAKRMLEKGVLAIDDEKDRKKVIRLFSSDKTAYKTLTKYHDYLNALY